MAVTAADFALNYLGLQTLQAHVPEVSADIQLLLALVVEFQDDPVALRAVHTRVMVQIPADPGEVPAVPIHSVLWCVPQRHTITSVPYIVVP
jgi:hypothetical protein